MYFKNTNILGNNWSMAVSTPLTYATYNCLPSRYPYSWPGTCRMRRCSSTRGRVVARDLLPPSGGSSLLLPEVEDAFRGCQQLEPGYTRSIPGLGLLYSCYSCMLCWIASRRCGLQSGESLGPNPTEVWLSELQVNCCFKGAPMHLILSGHLLTFFLGAVKAKTSFFKIKPETRR